MFLSQLTRTSLDRAHLQSKLASGKDVQKPSDDAVRVEDKDAGIGQVHVARVRLDPVGGMVVLDVRVQHAEPAHHVAARIRQERIRDAVPVREALQDLDRVIADREQRDAVLGERAGYPLQLDELRLAEGSPLRAAVKEHERPFSSARGVQVDGRARLVRQDDVGEAVPLSRPDRAPVAGLRRHWAVLPARYAARSRPSMALAIA